MDSSEGVRGEFLSLHARRSLIVSLLVVCAAGLGSFIQQSIGRAEIVQNNTRDILRLTTRLDSLEDHLIDEREKNATQNEAIRRLQQDEQDRLGRDKR